MKKNPEENHDQIGGNQPLGMEQQIPEPQEPSQGEDWAPTAKENPRPLVPEAEYEAMCVRQGRTFHKLFKRGVLALTFEIFEGPQQGTQLQRFYALSKNAGRGSAYFQEWTLANNDVAPLRGDRLSPKKFHGKLFRVQVTTVRTGWHGRSLPESLKYSKVAAILGLLVTNESIQ